MSNIFFPENLSPQGYLTDMILGQMRSRKAPFPDFRKLIYSYDYSDKTGKKLFCLHPDEKNILLKETLVKTPKNSSSSDGFFSKAKDRYIMRRYLNFLNSMTPAQQAALVPYIRLYVKVFKGDEYIKSREIVFNKDYRIPNAPNPLLDAGKGTGNAGIQSLSVSRDFQYYGITNRFSVEMDFLFDSFDTFANGMQYNNVLGAGLDALRLGTLSPLTGNNQGSGYINLIKGISQKLEGGDSIREYLMLEYGYKFPDDVDQTLVSNEDRLIFESQEKKELRINCFKHDFQFSETGEVRLGVSYVAAPEVALASRNETKTNDVFLISDNKLIDEILDEPSEKKVKQTKISETLKTQLKKLNELNKQKKKLVSDYCGRGDKKRASQIDREIQRINKQILSMKKALAGYMEHFFLRYFMATDSLFNMSFKINPMEIERFVLSPTNWVINDTEQATKNQKMTAFLNRVTPKIEERDEEGNLVNVAAVVTTNYKEKIKELYEKKYFSPRVKDSTSAPGSILNSEEIRKRFPENIEDVLPSEGTDKDIHLSYAYYEALQTFTMSRLAAQAALVRTGNQQTQQGPDPALTAPQPIEGTEADSYVERYGNISFFPLKALVAAAIDFTLDKEEDEKDFPIICLGNAIADSMGKEYNVNLGDLLIDKDFFKEWLHKEYLDSTTFNPTLDQFLNSIFESLVPSVLKAGLGHFSKGNHGYIGRQVFEVSKDVFNDKQIFKNLEDENPKIREKARTRLAAAIKKPAKKKELKRALIVYYQDNFNNPTDIKQSKASFLKNFGERNFDKKQDYNDGIYHVLIGQNTGIVNSINFDYVNDEYLNTLFAIRNPNNLAPYLRYSYEARVSFFGNDLFFGKSSFFAIPQNQFNVNQSGITIQRPSRDVFGLSGYYQISRTTDRISMGEYTTTVVAKNMYSPALEKAKKAKCPDRPSIGAPSTTGNPSQEKEKPIPSHVNHDIAEYIDQAFASVPKLRERFNIKLDKKIFEDQEAAREDS